MFLNQLTKQEKLAFLELARLVVNADREISSEEESLLATYLFEMQLENIIYKPVGLELKDILSNFVDKKSRRIVYIEALALAHSDQEYCKKEQAIVETMEEEFEITATEKAMINHWLERITQLYSEGYELINV